MTNRILENEGRSSREKGRTQRLSRRLKAEGRPCDRGCGRLGETVHHRKPAAEGGTLEDGWDWLCWPCHEDVHRAAGTLSQFQTPEEEEAELWAEVSAYVRKDRARKARIKAGEGTDDDLRHEMYLVMAGPVYDWYFEEYQRLAPKFGGA